MRAFVFTDESLERHAGQFVWLSIDTEKAGNAAFLKFPVEVLPTFFVLEPAAGKVVLRWVGGASVRQVEKILDDGRRAVAGRKARRGGRWRAQADRFYGEARNAEAARLYQEVLTAAPAGWPHYGRALESLLFSLQRRSTTKGCAETARDGFTNAARDAVGRERRGERPRLRPLDEA